MENNLHIFIITLTLILIIMHIVITIKAYIEFKIEQKTISHKIFTEKGQFWKYKSYWIDNVFIKYITIWLLLWDISLICVYIYYKLN